MISVSDAWKDIQRRFLLPETFIEIEYGVTDNEAQSVATASGTDEVAFSNTASIVGASNVTKYATNELNLWALDGSQTILPSSGGYSNAGYVSDIESTGNVTISFPAIRTTAISGVTITWSDVFGEYPRVFSVIGKNGDIVVSEVTVTDNKDKVSTVFVPLENYDSITVVVHAWDLPYRRVRIEKIVIGHSLTFTKSDLLSFTHEQSGDLLSGEIPKYSISFSLDNSDGRWDPNNPTGMAQYLSERQKLTVRYGLDVNGTIEWIKGGVFYLSEWNAPPNGIEAHFVARDVFEFLLATDTTKMPNMSSTQYGNLASIITWATNELYIDGIKVDVSDVALSSSPGRQYNADGTYAEMVQKCANAACCILRYDRNGALYVEQLKDTLSEYIPIVDGVNGIPLSLSYSYPEITLSKPLKAVVVDYGEETPFQLNVASNGEIQTLTNNYIYTAEAAESVANWVSRLLKMRKTISGEFRADPRLELFDIVNVEDRYGRVLKVAITNIKYDFNGSFRGSYTGRVIEEV